MRLTIFCILPPRNIWSDSLVGGVVIFQQDLIINAKNSVIHVKLLLILAHMLVWKTKKTVMLLHGVYETYQPLDIDKDR